MEGFKDFFLYIIIIKLHIHYKLISYFLDFGSSRPPAATSFGVQKWKNTATNGKKFGFLAYGSGSKSKVFEGTIQQGWTAAVQKAQLFETLQQSLEIDFETYLKLHKKEQRTSVNQPKNEWILERIEREIPNLIGARCYKWVE